MKEDKMIQNYDDITHDSILYFRDSELNWKQILYIIENNRRRMFVAPISTVILASQLLMLVGAINLVCNGDFQAYTVPTAGKDSNGKLQYYNYVFDDKNCWYRYSLAPAGNMFASGIEIKSPNMPYCPSNSKLMDLVSYNRYAACQKLSLSFNSIYQFNFSTFIDPIISNYILYVKLKYNSTYTWTIFTKKYSTIQIIYNESISFNTTNKNISQFCIWPDPINYLSILNILANSLQFGPNIDNVSLQLIASPPINATNQTTNQTNSSVPSIFIPEIITEDLVFNETTNNSQQSEKIIVYIKFVSFYDQASQRIILDSDFRADLFGMQPSSFSECQIQIQQTIQTNVQYSLTESQYLRISIIPNMLYDKKSMKSLKVHLPPNFNTLQTAYTFIVLVDGQTVQFSVLTKQQIKAFNDGTNILFKIFQGIKTIFLVTNTVSCSYFLINLIGFYNLSIMYLFLNIQILPDFARLFLINLAYIFFKKGSVLSFIIQITKIPNSIFSFSQFDLPQKIPEYIGDFVWYGFIDNSSNYLNNNFQSLLLLFNMLVKFLLFSKIVKMLPKYVQERINPEQLRFYQNYIGQISCFLPFFIVSFCSYFFDLNKQNFDQTVHIVFQMSTFLLFSIMFILGFSISFEGKPQHQDQIQQEKQEFQERKVHNINRYSYYVMCIIIPVFVCFRNKTVFFVLMTPLLLWRFYYSIKNRKMFKLFQNIIIITHKFAWIVYHFSFMILFILQSIYYDKIDEKNKDIVKYLGLIIIFSFLLGVLVDLTEVVVNLTHFVLKGLNLFQIKYQKDLNITIKIKFKIQCKEKLTLKKILI